MDLLLPATGYWVPGTSRGSAWDPVILLVGSTPTRFRQFFLQVVDDEVLRCAQDFAYGLRRPQNGSSSTPTRFRQIFLADHGQRGPSLRSGFRLRAQTPAKRLKFHPR